MKKIIAIAAFIAFSLNMNAQWWGGTKVKGDGKVITESRELGDYDGVSCAGSMKVILVSGDEGRVSIKADANLMEYIETEIEDGDLNIKIKKGYSVNPSEGKIVVTVPVTEISSLSLAGSGDIESTTVLNADNFKISVAGSGNLKAGIKAEVVKTSLAGSGNIDIKGSAGEMKLSVAGSGNFNGTDMKVTHVTASIAGSGNAKVHCDGSIKARIAGSGNLKYSGNPEIEDTKTIGSGKIIKI